jgi:hypothetical protein
MFSKLRLNKFNKSQLRLIGLAILLLALPLILSTLYFIQDTRGNAALPDQLETESGVLSASGVIRQTSSGASGGQYILFNKTQSSTPTPAPDSSEIYGNGWSMTSLDNTRIGWIGNFNPQSYRFRAEQSGTITALRVYWIGPSESRLIPDYAGGNGGKYTITIQKDDGKGKPNGQNLTGLGSIDVGAYSKVGLNITFNPKLGTITKGERYHIIFKNIDPDPVSNYSSLDGFREGDWDVGDIPPENVIHKWPANPNGDYGWLYYYQNKWLERSGHSPIMDITYDNGEHQGVGYIELNYNYLISSIGMVSGSNYKVRQLFTYSKNTRTFTQGAVRVAKSSVTTSPLVISVIDSNGITLGSISIPASNVPSLAVNNGSLGYGAAWELDSFNNPITLNKGSSYQFVLSTASNNTYYTWPIRKGVGHNYHSATYFSDGLAQYTTNGGSSWSSLGHTTNQNDLTFYLK